jgi:hypothetical protein
MHAI